MNSLDTRLLAQLKALDADIAARADDGVQLVNGADLKPEPINWLWKHWLASAKLHILAGAPGQGKTTIALGLAATVTLGGRWPDGTRCEAGNVLIWSGEDDPADTLLPRLIAAGGDPKRCYFVTGSRIDGESVPFDPARDLVRLTTAIERIGGVSLLIVDPVVSAVNGDSHKNAEVRRSLQPLVDIGAACRCAVLGITHFSKGGHGLDPTQRVIGSVAFAAMARIVMVAAKVKGEDGEPARVLARSKSNIGPDDGGFRYFLDQREALPGIEASSISWGEAVKGTARELLTDPDADDEADDEGDAAEMLRAEMADGEWVAADAVTAPLKQAGFTKKQIWSASKKLQVERKKDGYQGVWRWRLAGGLKGSAPKDSPKDSKGSSFGNGESMESLGAMESLGGPVGDPEGVQKSSKVSTQNDGHLRENLDTFGDSAEPDPAPERPADDDVEVFE